MVAVQFFAIHEMDAAYEGENFTWVEMDMTDVH